MKLKPEKNSGLNGIRTHDLCDYGAFIYFFYHVLELRALAIKLLTLLNIMGYTVGFQSFFGQRLPFKNLDWN